MVTFFATVLKEKVAGVGSVFIQPVLVVERVMGDWKIPVKPVRFAVAE